MGSEANTSSSSSSSSVSSSAMASPSSSKRSRDAKDEVYVDNLNSHKRYLSEMMASSLNCLTVGDSLPDNLMDTPARSENFFYPRDDVSLQYSPMSEDSDDARYFEASVNTSSSQPESAPSSPVSPYRYQRSSSGWSSGPPTTSFPSHGCTVSAGSAQQPRQRGSESEGRFPSSPSDICHSADLRRAALLRSVQMRTQPPGPSPFELPYSSGQEPGHNMEAEDQPCPQMKSLIDEREYQVDESSLKTSETGNQEDSCKMLNTNMKGDESADLNT